MFNWLKSILGIEVNSKTQQLTASGDATIQVGSGNVNNIVNYNGVEIPNEFEPVEWSELHLKILKVCVTQKDLDELDVVQTNLTPYEVFRIRTNGIDPKQRGAFDDLVECGFLEWNGGDTYRMPMKYRNKAKELVATLD
jgi:hypothetical protein